MTKLDDVLHPMEQKRLERIPWEQHAGDGVILERRVRETLPIVSDGDTMQGQFADAMERISRGQANLNNLLLPVEIQTERRGTLQISLNERFYFDDEGVHIQLEDASVDEDGRIYLDFKETSVCFPRRTWTMRTFDVARYVEEERLLSDAEVNERATEALEDFREGSA